MTTPFRTNKTNRFSVIEACVGSVEEACYAQAHGADRLELCSALEQDGLTPMPALIKAVQSQVTIPIKVMIRPRAGHFEYNDKERKRVEQEVASCKALGIRDFVYGSIREGHLDLEDIKLFYDLYDPINLTIHKAIDTSQDILKDVFDVVKWVKATRAQVSILSSGGQATAIQGAMMLNRMHRLCGNDVELIVAGKVTSDNLDIIKGVVPARAYHGRKIV